MKKLTTLLSNNQWYTQSKLSELLNLSPEKIFYKIKSLQKMGLTFDVADSHKKYRLKSQLDFLDKKKISLQLNHNIANNLSLHSIFITDSTNDYVKKIAKKKGHHVLYACITEYQKKARGRYGKTWINPLGSTIALSLHMLLNKKIESLDGLSLVVGMSIVQSFRTLSKKNIGLKWPNDIFWNNKKLGGILLETSENHNGNVSVTIGIGININLDSDQLESISKPSTDTTRAFGKLISRNKLIPLILNTLIPALKKYEKFGFSDMHRKWHHYDILAGKNINITLANQKITGLVQGINDTGQLILKNSYGTHAFSAGEVSLQLDL